MIAAIATTVTNVNYNVKQIDYLTNYPLDWPTETLCWLTKIIFM